MKSETKRSLLRVLKIFTAIIALPIFALAPAYLASLMLIDQTVEPDEPSEQAATIDIMDIDRDGTVMYTVSQAEDFRSDPFTDFTLTPDVLKDADIIRITVSDDDNTHSFFESEMQNDCSFTLHLSDDDRFDADSDTFTGYLRVTGEAITDYAGTDFEQREDCGLYVIYTD